MTLLILLLIDQGRDLINVVNLMESSANPSIQEVALVVESHKINNNNK